MGSRQHPKLSFFDDNYKIVKGLGIVYIIAGSVHVLFLIIFFFLDILPAMIMNIVSPVMYIFAYQLNRKNKVLAGAYFGITEVFIHSSVLTLTIGWESGFHYYLLLLFPLIFFTPKKGMKFKILTAILIGFVFITLFKYESINQPVYQVSLSLLHNFNIVNLSITMFVLSVFSYVYSTTAILIEGKLKDNAKELEKVVEAKDRLFSIVAHDLKNPFNSLLGFTELLLTNFDQYPTEKQIHFIQTIHNIGKRSYELLINLLDWARSQLGEIVIKHEKLNLLNSIEQNLTLFQNELLRKEIQVHLDRDLDFVIISDIQILNTIFRNLISNAIKFSSHNKSIYIGVASRSPEMVELYVKDEGVGIPKDVLEQLFVSKLNISQKGTDNEHGTGLGLLLCFELINKLEGTIKAESTPGEGTIFLICLPLDDRARFIPDPMGKNK